MYKEQLLFLIHTEYHLMVTASIIEENYSDPSKYLVTILLTKEKKGKRFNFNVDTSAFKNVQYHELFFDAGDFNFNKELSGIIKKISGISYKFYVGFLEQHPLNIFFAKTLKKRGTVICLAPDGTKPYGEITKLALFSRIRMTIANYRFLFANHLYVKSFDLIDWNYGKMKEIDELWVCYTKGLCNVKQKKVRVINIFSTVQSRQLVCRLFNFNPAEKLTNLSNLIFYINQPVNKQEIYDCEITLLKSLKAMNPAKSLYIKLHPKTPVKQIEKYHSELNCKIIEDTVPAELYIANLLSSIVISFWSAALLINNEDCKFYWLYPILKKDGIMVNWLKITNPTEHIAEIDDVLDLKEIS